MIRPSLSSATPSAALPLGVLRHPDWLEGAFLGGARPWSDGRARVEPDVATHHGEIPPQLDVLVAAHLEMCRPRDAERCCRERVVRPRRA